MRGLASLRADIVPSSLHVRHAFVSRRACPKPFARRPVTARAHHRWGGGPSIGGVQFRNYCWRQAEHGLQRASYVLLRSIQTTALALADGAVWLERSLDLRWRLARLWHAASLQAANLDARWGIRQRAFDLWLDFRRHWPQVRV